jgi:hypothetical protein
MKVKRKVLEDAFRELVDECTKRGRALSRTGLLTTFTSSSQVRSRLQPEEGGQTDGY